MLRLSPEYLANHQFYKGTGCKKCGHTGYKGRKAITELIRNVPTTVIRDRMSSTMIITSFICTLRSTGGTPFHSEWKVKSGDMGPAAPDLINHSPWANSISSLSTPNSPL